MKLLSVLLTSLALVSPALAQVPLAPADALARLYHGYDAENQTAQWTCGDEKGNWDCSSENRTVQIDLMLNAEVWENGTAKIYIVANAKPKDYGWHACAPALGVAVFAWEENQWQVESSNLAIGFYGGYGDPPGVSMEKIGPERYGILLSGGDLAQGYAWSYKDLLVAYKKSVTDAWSIQDEQDDEGAYDPTDKSPEHVRWRSAAAYRFDPVDGNAEYYDIEVISRGNDRQDQAHPIQQENWTERYRFVDGKYKLIKRTSFSEVRKPQKTK